MTLPLIAFIALTAGNAIFVAAEFALVTVDRGAVDRQAATGDMRAVRVRAAVRDLSFQLSGAQLGITITALLTGYLAEPALAQLIAPILPLGGTAQTGLAAVLALIVATLFSMLFGELVPKNIAIARPIPTATRTAGFQTGFSKAFRWLIQLLNGSANAIVRGFGVQPQDELASARSPEELGLLAAYSAKAGALPEETALLLRRTIRFSEKRAAEAMTPRVDVVGLAADDTVCAAITRITDTGISRFPVYEETLDHVIGVITVADLLGVPPERRETTPVRAVCRSAVLVPDSLDLDRVLLALQTAGADLAIVVDEYGGTDGVVTLEDLVEELVGEIADEYDTVAPTLQVVEPSGAAAAVTAPSDARTWIVDGMSRSDEVADISGFRLPDGPYETLAGFVLARLGHIPVTGETVCEDGWEFTVIEVERRRVEQVRIVAPAGEVGRG